MVYTHRVRGVKKRDLPDKICPACGRQFSWRRKWARDWDAVLYCGERCRREAKKSRAKGS